ncbi:MAG: M28 family peptidase [Candidatus Rokubacteria bacterium]|nr:M28 family peptidase [Candidatus Rokubacteria bacterium]
MKFRRLPRLAALLLVPAVALAGAAPPIPSATWLLDQVKILSAPEMEGRASGTPGADRAAGHIAQVFRKAGLRPCCGNGYLQTFEVVTGTRLGTPNSFALVTPAPRPFALGRDFTPVAVSSDGTAEGDVIFVGYGITAGNLHYDDYAGVDARGKIVLAMSGDPGAADPASPFRRPEAYHYAERSHKIINAREHGARAMILVSRPGSERERLPTLRGITQPWGIQVVFVTRKAAGALLAPSGKQLAALQETIDRSLTPQSFPLPGVRVKLEVALVRERGTAANVAGILPGTDPRLKDESIVIGAHYDHLGRGGEGSLAPDEIGKIHFGADDNASGTTGVMALARTFAARGGLPRTLVFVAFGGEELGILGSSHYTQHPLLPLEKTVLMLNMDMIGRLRDEKLYVFGVESGMGLREIVADAAKGLTLKLQLRGDPFSPSDHTPFYLRERPVLFLFTGAHADYHKPADTWEKINAQGMETVVTFTARILERVGSATPPPAYVKLAPPPSRGGGGYGPFFGVVPDFSEGERPGVRLGGVRPGSPADKAGVKAGDIIIRFAGVDVKTLDDLTFALRSRRAGDKVEVILLRDGKDISTEATLGERR